MPVDLVVENIANLKSAKLQPETRRQFIKRIGLDGVLAYFAIEKWPVKALVDEKLKEFMERVPRHFDTQVMPYSSDIVDAATRLVAIPRLEDIFPHRYSSNLIGAIFGNELSAGRTRRNSRGIFLISALGALAHRIVNHYFDGKIANLMEDPRFYDYGMSRHFVMIAPYREGEVILNPPAYYLLNPAALMLDASIVASGYFYPTLGYALGADVPFSAQFKLHQIKVLQLAYDIGDEIAKRIANNDAPAAVRGYLKHLKVQDLKK